MRVDHVFGGHIYLISNYGVARNPIFRDSKDVEFFRSNIQKYLGELCEIYAYSHQVNQFHYLLKLNDRKNLEDFFHKKQALKKVNIAHNIYDKEAKAPPDSYLIFSQEVSNCLNSYAKKFNSKYKRKGGLFGSRYSKTLIENENEMEECVKKLNSMDELISFRPLWKYQDQIKLTNRNGECSSAIHYSRNQKPLIKNTLYSFSVWVKGNVRGCFDCLPPPSVKAPDFDIKYQEFVETKGYPPPW